MDRSYLKALLDQVSRGELAIDKAADKLSRLTYEDIEYAHIDHHRSLRKGFPEVIYAEGKTVEQIIGILNRMTIQESIVLATRVAADKAAAIKKHFPDCTYYADARMIIWGKPEIASPERNPILVISAGTSDIPVAREAFLTAQAMGNPVEQAFDVGVAGIHRLFAHREQIETAGVLIVVAGMEGALPSVVAGMVDRPVIAVPTSVGYGCHLGGLTAMFAMLNSCSSNVAVVNIDNGFGAGYMAGIINQP
jgi:NCAIR mutase (PurE)-related protein